VKVWESVSIKSVRDLSVMWGGDGVGGEWPARVDEHVNCSFEAPMVINILIPSRSACATCDDLGCHTRCEDSLSKAWTAHYG